MSEATITGIGTGLALGGYLPLVEIMFGDFLTLTFDQLLQHACKICQMYGQWIDVPLILRTPMGGKRGYGPTHSQSIEKHFFGIANLTILALNHRLSPDLVYENLFKTCKNPTLVLENKMLYAKFLHNQPIPGFSVLFSDEVFPSVKISPIGVVPDITIVCYGGMLEDVEAAAQLAFDEEEITCEIICPSMINPLNINPIAKSVSMTGKLITVEEGNGVAGFGSEITSCLLEFSVIPKWFQRVSYNFIIPSSLSRELELLPNVQMILDAIRKAVK